MSLAPIRTRKARSVHISFEQVSPEDTAELRLRYLNGLEQAQELMIEMLVPHSEHHLIRYKGELCGYFLLHHLSPDEDVILEFSVFDAHVPHCHEILRTLLAHTNATSAWIKTFDHLFLSHAMDLQIGVRTLGCLARGYVPRELPSIPSIRYTRRVAEASDFERLRAVPQDVFADPERLRHVIQRGYLHVFERDDTLVGFGIARPVIEGRPDTELGIVVDVPFRNRGYAIYLLRDLAEHCVQNGLTPIAGCAFANIASWRMGLRAGMISHYRLLEVRFR